MWRGKADVDGGGRLHHPALLGGVASPDAASAAGAGRKGDDGHPAIGCPRLSAPPTARPAHAGHAARLVAGQVNSPIVRLLLPREGRGGGDDERARRIRLAHKDKQRRRAKRSLLLLPNVTKLIKIFN